MTPREGTGRESLPGLRTVHRLAVATAVLSAVAAGAGLFVPGLYRDNALVSAAWFGNDLITFVVAVPMLAVAVARSAGGSRRWRLVLLGLLLYAFYSYAFYLFGAAFNALFLVYVTIAAAAGYGLLLGLASLDVPSIAEGFSRQVPARAIGAFMVAVGVLLGGFWVSTSLAFLVTGRPPGMVEATGHPTNVTGALDLGLVVVLAIVAGAWLWQRRPWGYVLGVVWSVKGAVYMLALSSAAVTTWQYGPADDLTQLALWLPIGLGSTLAALALVNGYRGG